MRCRRRTGRAARIPVARTGVNVRARNQPRLERFAGRAANAAIRVAGAVRRPVARAAPGHPGRHVPDRSRPGTLSQPRVVVRPGRHARLSGQAAVDRIRAGRWRHRGRRRTQGLRRDGRARRHRCLLRQRIPLARARPTRSRRPSAVGAELHGHAGGRDPGARRLHGARTGEPDVRRAGGHHRDRRLESGSGYEYRRGHDLRADGPRLSR